MDILMNIQDCLKGGYFVLILNGYSDEYLRLFEVWIFCAYICILRGRIGGAPGRNRCCEPAAITQRLFNSLKVQEV